MFDKEKLKQFLEENKQLLNNYKIEELLIKITKNQYGEKWQSARKLQSDLLELLLKLQNLYEPDYYVAIVIDTNNIKEYLGEEMNCYYPNGDINDNEVVKFKTKKEAQKAIRKYKTYDPDSKETFDILGVKD